jgi:hypothetical protein
MSVASDLAQVLEELAAELTGGAVSPGRDQALAAVQTFEAESGATAWPHLNRRGVAARARYLVNSPASIQQGSLGLCGPAAVLRFWIARDPVAFVKLVAGLFNTGTGMLGSLTVTAGEGLRNQDYGAIANQLLAECPMTDWMVMCAMRDSANWLLPYLGQPDEEYAEGSSAGDVVKWLTATGLYSTVEEWFLNVNDPINDMLTLAPGPDCDVALVVNAKIFEGQSISGSVGKFIERLLPNNPNHVMILNEAVTAVGSDGYRLSVWTWGSNYTLVLDSTALIANYTAALVAEV